MTWLVSLAVSLLSGVAGLLLAGFIANACVTWYHVSSREGASGYFVLFTAVGGGVAGLVIGLVVARLVAGHFGAGFLRELGGALGVILVLAGMAAGLCRALADVPPRLAGRELILEVEFRFPEGPRTDLPPTAEGEWQMELAALSGHATRKRDHGVVKTNEARWEAGQWIVPTEAELFTSRGGRSVSLSRVDATELTSFVLPLPGQPGRAFLEWSPWLPRQQANGQPWPADRMSCRFRLRQVTAAPPTPAPLTDAEWRAQEAARKEAEFASIPADAPVQAWFPYVSWEQPQTERAWRTIAGRPNVVAELGGLATGDDADLAGAALRCIAGLPGLTAAWNAPVQAAGRDLEARIRQVNGLTVDQDPSYEGAAAVSMRFSGWMEAVRALRGQAGGDFTPELKAILELSRVRPDSQAMRSDVCRVASHYLREWAGVEPLPTDPKPR